MPAASPSPTRPAAVKATGWRRLGRLLLRAGKSWVDHRAASKGAAVAFYTMFSMAPILVLVTAIAGAFFGPSAAQGEIVSQLSGLVGEVGAQAIQTALVSANNDRGGTIATVIATALLLVGATTVFSELKDSLDDIWQVPKPPAGGVLTLIRTRLLSFGLILVLGFLLLVSLVVNAMLAVLQSYWSGVWSNFLVVLTPLASLFSFLVIAGMFAAIFKMLPQAPLSWRDVVIGSLGTAALFTLGKYLIGVYLGNSGVTSTYGAAGSLAALLIWIYYSAQIFFFGAEFTRQYALTFGSLREASPDAVSSGGPANKAFLTSKKSVMDN
ncbi:YihY/virulence factor BrkB family protein [Oxalobacteraceae bacterium CAVE-383]|nr:YihY/virulence factor BrkB family protein [Oxalobacteraceae bacterium CAVE-383]